MSCPLLYRHVIAAALDPVVLVDEYQIRFPSRFPLRLVDHRKRCDDHQVAQLRAADLTSSAGKMTMQVLCAVAEFERDLLIERTQSGLARVKAEGKTLGRKPGLTPAQQVEARARLAQGVSVAQLARDYKTIRQTIMRVRDRA
jgi:DNA invertase Pin-like site-specific DNA recombinase